MDHLFPFDYIRILFKQDHLTSSALVSGHFQKSSIERLSTRSFDGFIQKPFNIGELSEKIEMILGK